MTAKTSRNRSALLAFLILSAVVLAALTVDSTTQAHAVDVGQRLYDLKMKAKGACQLAREYEKERTALWNDYRAGKVSRRDYDLGYAISNSQKHICVRAKEVYYILKNARDRNIRLGGSGGTLGGGSGDGQITGGNIAGGSPSGSGGSVGGGSSGGGSPSAGPGGGSSSGGGGSGGGLLNVPGALGR